MTIASATTPSARPIEECWTYAGVKADLRRQLDGWIKKAEDPFVPGR
ncbi:MAG: hypothetical protein ACYC64_04380 [Armatimonadota bacterium]